MSLSEMEQENQIKEFIRQAIHEVLGQKSLQAEVITSIKKQTPSQNSERIENLARWLRETPQPLRKKISKERFCVSNPARIGIGRTGTRYLTPVALQFRADHAVAKDAVYAELPDGFAEKNNWVPLQTQATSKEEYLLRPDLGRKLSENSLKKIIEMGIKNPDVQIIVADGLSPWATEKQAPSFVQELTKLLNSNGLNIGTVFCVKYSRIAVQDVIGEALGAKVSMILLGERPGLGGGDSLSNYMIYGPKVGAVNALKSMISNIHPGGFAPHAAAELTLHMIQEMFKQKCSGVNLKI